MHETEGQRCVVSREDFPALLAALRDSGHELVGPTVRDQAIVCDAIAGVDDLPVGWTDVQDAGRYRLERRDDEALFGYTLGPQAWKKFLQLPRLTLWSARRDGDGFRIEVPQEAPPRLAFIGARSCELQALAVQDRVLSGGAYTDSDYARRRAQVFILAVQCAQAGGTCFCTSMETGPRATTGFDLGVTEIIAAGRHDFVVETGTPAGAAVIAQVPSRPATDQDWQAALAATQRAAGQMGRQLDTVGIRDLLYRNTEHAHWDDVAERCLACANCTLVCPTCFCTATEDSTDLPGETASRTRHWDSCFNSSYSSIHGGVVRQSTRSRYRQWLTHKLASWHDQFGSSGCVGCGRCITWCPVGIDITAEVAAIRAGEHAEAAT